MMMLNKPDNYLKFVDDILLFTSTDEINIIKYNYVLNFIQELSIDNKIPSLGVLIDTSNNNKFITSLYKKTKTLIPVSSITIVIDPSVIKESS